MKWNQEWVDLDTVERLLAECRSLDRERQEQYMLDVVKRKDLLFVGWPGRIFLELLPDYLTKKGVIDWTPLYRDVRFLKAVIEKCSQREKPEVRQIYLKLKNNSSHYFLTEMGAAFFYELERKLEELDVPIQESRQRKQVILLACISVSFLAIWLYTTLDAARSREEIKRLQQRTKIYASQETFHEGDVGNAEARPQILPEYQELFDKNQELFGWLSIPGTDLDLPVFQPREDAEFYLDHNWEGVKNEEGALFVDSQCTLLPLNQNVVIYGHNMKNGRMFGGLKKFETPEYLENHKKLTFHTIYEKRSYTILAVLKTQILERGEPGFRYYQSFSMKTQEEWDACAAFIEENSILSTGEEMQFGDQLLMLSTCEYSTDHGRLVIVARHDDEG